jgi:hypothetical protein
MRYVVWAVVLAGLGLVVFAGVPLAYVLGPLVGLLIAKIGLATFGAMRAGAHTRDDAPQPLDPRLERVTYSCEGCGAELLLLVRGTALPPRHCGERMAERHEISRSQRVNPP